MNSPVIVHMSFAKIYEFDGWVFEYHRTKPFPPWPLKKDLEPRKRAGRNFWKMFEKFRVLDIDQQEELRL